MVRKTSGSGTDTRAANASTDNATPDAAGKAKAATRTRRKPATEGAAKTTKAERVKAPAPSEPAAQPKPAAAPAAEQQRPEPEVAAAASESGFEAGARKAGQVFGAIRDSVRKGADKVGDLTSEDGLTHAAGAAKDAAGRNAGVLAAGAAVVFGGLPAVAVTLGAGARLAKLTLVDGQDPIDASKQVAGELNGLAKKAPEIAGQAVQLAGQAKEALTGFAARFGLKKKD